MPAPPARARARRIRSLSPLDEIGIDLTKHRPRTFEELEDLDGLNFDLIVTLSPEAHHRALELTRTLAVDVEYWPTVDPTRTEGSREQRLDSYRDLRDHLMTRIKQRFGWRPGPLLPVYLNTSNL
jgi:protein-tyrosine-phosphatase